MPSNPQGSGSVLRVTAILGLAAVVTKVLGFGRETVMAAVFGATHLTDALTVASTFVLSTFAVVPGAIVSTIMPRTGRSLAEGGTEQMERYASGELRRALVIGAISAAIIAWKAEVVVSVLSPGLPADYQQMSASMLRWFSPLIVTTPMLAVYQSASYVGNRYAAPVTANLVFSLMLFGGALLSYRQGLNGMVISMSVGGVLAVLVAHLLLQKHVKLTLLRAPVDSFPVFARGFLPVLVAEGLAQGVAIVARFMASQLGPGAISHVAYASKLVQLPVAILAASSVMASYAAMSRSADNQTRFSLSLVQGLRGLLWLLMPVIVMMAMESDTIVRIAFERGAFSVIDTRATAQALIGAVPGILGAALWDLGNRGFFALGQPRATLVAAVCAVITTPLVGFATLPLGGLGVTLAVSAGQLVAGIVLFYGLHKRTGFLRTSPLWGCVTRIMLAALFQAATIFALRATLGPTGSPIKVAGGFCLSVIVGMAIYVAASVKLGVEEARAAISAFTRLVDRMVRG